MYAHAHVEPRSKNSITTVEKQAFQSALAEGLGTRRGFRAPVMIEFDLHATADNPPEIHTVIKNYMDLTYRATVGSGRLIGDDRQVRHLAVRYSMKMLNKPSIWVRAARMSDFREDIALAREIHTERDRDYWREEDRLDELLDDLRQWERDRSSTVSRHGQEMFDAHQLFTLTRLQQAWLAGTERMLHPILLDLLSGALTGLAKEIELRGVRWPATDLNDDAKRLLFSSAISLDLAPLPQRPGEGEVFNTAVDVALSSMRTKHPFLFPLHTELALVILLVPPIKGGIDFDNLARKIIPRVHSILEPPSGKHIPDPSKVTDPRIRSFFERQLLTRRRLPKHHVTRYEVVELPRTSSDPPAGSVRLVFCDGAEGQTFVEFVDDTIKEWDDKHR